MLKKSNIIYVLGKRDDEPMEKEDDRSLRCLSAMTRLRHNFGEVFGLITFDGKNEISIAGKRNIHENCFKRKEIER